MPGAQRLAGGSEPVGLVVDHGEARRLAGAGHAHHQVEAARQVPPQPVLQRGVAEALGVAGEHITGGDVLAQHRGDVGDRHLGGGVVAAGEGQLEAQLVDPVGSAHVAQAGLAHQRSERRLHRGPQPGRHRRRVAHVDVAAGPFAGEGDDELTVEVGGGEVDALEHAVHQRAHLGAPGHGAQQ